MFEESLPYPRRTDHNADEHLQQQVALLQRFFKNSKALWNGSEMDVFRKIALIRNDQCLHYYRSLNHFGSQLKVSWLHINVNSFTDRYLVNHIWVTF